MEGMGLGGWVEQLGELKLGELLDTPPPGEPTEHSLPLLLETRGFKRIRFLRFLMKRGCRMF